MPPSDVRIRFRVESTEWIEFMPMDAERQRKFAKIADPIFRAACRAIIPARLSGELPEANPDLRRYYVAAAKRYPDVLMDALAIAVEKPRDYLAKIDQELLLQLANVALNHNAGFYTEHSSAVMAQEIEALRLAAIASGSNRIN